MPRLKQKMEDALKTDREQAMKKQLHGDHLKAFTKVSVKVNQAS